FTLSKISKPKQYIISVVSVLAVAGICFSLSEIIPYKIVALILLVSVSLIAMFFEIWPVLIAATLSALVWNFFFIPPRFTFAIHEAEDVLMFFMYFVIAILNGVMTFKIRQVEKASNKKEEEEKTLKLYNTVLNSLSHELRTPIATIIGATDNLQTNDGKISEENKHELISEISKASFRLNRQVENLLNMSRLESGFIQPKKDWCDINELVYDVVNRQKENLQGHVVSILIKENLPLFKLDHGLLEQVLENLILNAALYIPKYAVITVRANCVNDKLVLHVEDTGNGFPDNEIDKVFDKFYRLKNSNTGGTGLGLSIVKGFVEAQNGIINLENMEEGGARFTIEIPAETTYINNLKNE
ncbi:MAG TPA: ATP-binding protein, partial [Bacteroidia bacterium]|nr:ATP-binding protein [Bacteroidia bacterium]